MAAVIKTSYAPSTTTVKAPYTNAEYGRDICEHGVLRVTTQLKGLINCYNNCSECKLKQLRAKQEIKLQKEGIQFVDGILILSDDDSSDDDSSNEEAARIQAENDGFRQRLELFYRKHAPHQLCNVPDMVDKFQGRETKLFRVLENKYIPGKAEEEARLKAEEEARLKAEEEANNEKIRNLIKEDCTLLVKK